MGIRWCSSTQPAGAGEPLDRWFVHPDDGARRRLDGSIYIIPVYCAQIQGYNAQQIGYVVMWSGLPQLFLFR
jgi:hypothetical protein